MKNLLLLGLVLISGVLLAACENKTEENLEEIWTCSSWEAIKRDWDLTVQEPRFPPW